MDEFPRDREEDQDVRIRRTTLNMRDFLAPAHDQAQMVLYCHALATTSNAQLPCALMTTSNELDVMITDTCGERSDYTQLCHGLIARGRNLQIGRKDIFWSGGAPEESVMLQAADVIANLAELYCLPVQRGLVQDVRHWEGAKLLPSQWGQKQSVTRPAVFDPQRTKLPAVIEFTPMPPQQLLWVYGLDESKRLVEAAIRRRGAQLNMTRAARSGTTKTLGRRRCNALDPLGRRGDPEKPPKLPHFAGSKSRVRKATQELKRKRTFYSECRETFRNGRKDVVFAAGTVMFRKLGAFCDPLPPSRVKLPPFKHHARPPPHLDQ